MEILSNKLVTSRIEHICNGCKRKFPKGTKIKIQTNIMDGIQTLKTCPTCTELIVKHKKYFEDGDGICYDECVLNSLDDGQTPEELLNKLNREHCEHEWYETDNFYIKCKKCNKLK